MKTVNGLKYKTCEKADDTQACVHCGRELKSDKPVVCQRNFPKQVHKSSLNTRSDKNRLQIIEDTCTGCKYFRDRGKPNEHRCLAAGCQKSSLWARLKLKKWVCPKGVWDDTPDVNKPKWVSNRHLVRDTGYLIEKMPNDIDAIVAVPRSGMMPASFIATTLHLPLYSLTPQGTFELCSSHGRSTRFGNQDIKHALVVDDTVCRGGTMRSVDKMLANKGVKYTTACVYMSPLHQKNVDLYAKELPDPHILEWNVFNAPLTRATGFDIDGILCPDVPASEDDDGERYVKCLQNMPVRYAIRRHPALELVTARLEKYREVTEKWLDDSGILYKKLTMGPWKTNKERAKKGAVARFKARVYKNDPNMWLFIESDDCLASQIARISLKNVACPQTERIY